SGWIGLTVLGSLLHLLAVRVRVRDPGRGMPQPRPGRDIALTAVAALAAITAAVAALGADPLEQAGQVVLIAAYILLGGRVALLGARVLRTARPRI
ncbi:MAG: hypothetical protein KJ006_06640, partial [Thermoleophilia bacterium]|nr:hypothetical protein [Thermoleophilia bacterium]